MENVNVLEILRVGVIGLGFLLALLSYKLLVAEQKKENERPGMLRAIYVFMVFSVVLTLVGLFSEFLNSKSEKNNLTPITKKVKVDLKEVCLSEYNSVVKEDFPTSEIVRLLKNRSLSYGWSGGLASQSRENYETENFFKISDITLAGDAIKLYYLWENGSLTLYPEQSDKRGIYFVGFWSQDNGEGCVQLQFDSYFTEAIGTWNKGPNSDYRSSYIKLTEKFANDKG